MTNKTRLSLSSKDNFLFETDNISNTLRTNGRSKSPEDVNILEMFLQQYSTQPKLYRMSADDSGSYFNWDMLRLKLKILFPESKILFTDTFYDIAKDAEYNKQEIWNLRDGLMIQMEGGLSKDFYLVNYDLSNTQTLTSYNLFLIKDNFPEQHDVVSAFKECQVEKMETISIGMVSWDEGNFYVKDFDLKDKSVDLQLLDEHYGTGFIEFNDKLIKRLTEETKGLTLFHGIHGSGKCVRGNTIVKIRNKKTGVIEEINIEELL